MNSRFNIKIVLAIVWLVLTCALTLWWMIFAMSLIEKVDNRVANHQSMLVWEGGTLLMLLLVGGVLLIYYVLREKQQNAQLQLFFAGFTHDVKTRLAGVKLQVESLKADNRDEKLNLLINRLLTDSSRLQVQVENSLYVGGNSNVRLSIESFSLKSLLEFLQESWPQVDIVLEREVKLRADKRVFENAITNLLHNCISHGQATKLAVKVEQIKSDCVKLQFNDNGSGFSGDLSRLGEKFYRHNPSSGSGLGLYTVRQSIERMNGKVLFKNGESGLCVEVLLPGEVL